MSAIPSSQTPTVTQHLHAPCSGNLLTVDGSACLNISFCVSICHLAHYFDNYVTNLTLTTIINQETIGFHLRAEYHTLRHAELVFKLFYRSV